MNNAGKVRINKSENGCHVQRLACNSSQFAGRVSQRNNKRGGESHRKPGLFQEGTLLHLPTACTGLARGGGGSNLTSKLKIIHEGVPSIHPEIIQILYALHTSL